MNNYKEYLQSDHWKNLSEETKRLAGYRCQVCNKGGELHTHHRTYERRGNEFQGDLIVLCAKCHKKFHSVWTGASLQMVDNTINCDSLMELSLMLPQFYTDPQYINSLKNKCRIVIDCIYTIEFDSFDVLYDFLRCGIVAAKKYGG
jgi:DNA-directed RNA polymerase subunit RPC12/RpoP